MRKQLGAGRKSAEGIVFDPCGRRRPEGNEQVRISFSSHCSLLWFAGDQIEAGQQVGRAARFLSKYFERDGLARLIRFDVSLQSILAGRLDVEATSERGD